MNNGDYPDGAAEDPKAPYNYKNYGECSSCEGTGSICADCDYPSNSCQCENSIPEELKECIECNGTGEKSEEQYIDEKESWEEDMNKD